MGRFELENLDELFLDVLFLAKSAGTRAIPALASASRSPVNSVMCPHAALANTLPPPATRVRPAGTRKQPQRLVNIPAPPNQFRPPAPRSHDTQRAFEPTEKKSKTTGKEKKGKKGTHAAPSAAFKNAVRAPGGRKLSG